MLIRPLTLTSEVPPSPTAAPQHDEGKLPLCGLYKGVPTAQRDATAAAVAASIEWTDDTDRMHRTVARRLAYTESLSTSAALTSVCTNTSLRTSTILVSEATHVHEGYACNSCGGGCSNSDSKRTDGAIVTYRSTLVSSGSMPITSIVSTESESHSELQLDAKASVVPAREDRSLARLLALIEVAERNREGPPTSSDIEAAAAAMQVDINVAAAELRLAFKSREAAMAVCRNFAALHAAARAILRRTAIADTGLHELRSLLDSAGPLPGATRTAVDAARLSFWLAATLPLSSELRIRMLGTASLGERLWVALQVVWPAYGEPASGVSIDEIAEYVECGLGMRGGLANVADATGVISDHAPYDAAVKTVGHRGHATARGVHAALVALAAGLDPPTLHSAHTDYAHQVR